MKTFLIIGASSGIGKALTEKLVSLGHQVVGTYNGSVVNRSSKSESYHHFDVLDESTEIDFIPEKLDGLVYCPGAIQLLPFKRIKQDQLLDDFKLQVGGAIKTIQAALPALQASEHSSIVLFSTVAVQSGFNFHAQVATSKGAIEGLTRSLAAEFAPKIRVNAIAPSLTNTPLADKLLNSPEKIAANGERHPLKRVGEASDIANMASFLLSDDASWITGQILHVDGGISNLKI